MSQQGLRNTNNEQNQVQSGELQMALTLCILFYHPLNIKHT